MPRSPKRDYTPAMEIDVRYFAAAREIAGHDAERFDVRDESDLEVLTAALKARHPDLDGLVLRYAVGDRFVERNHKLEDGDVVALIPPVSGG